MIICEITRNKEYFCSLSPYSPFVFTGYTGYYEFSTEWGSSLGDEIVQSGIMSKVLQVSRDFLNKYTKSETLNDCVSQEGSYYFDKIVQQVYIHFEHGFNNIVSQYDYGYAIGMCSSMSGTTYIDDYEYLPLIISIPDIEQEADVVGSSKPTGITGSIVLNNTSLPDQITQVPRGELDFLISESVFGNDIFIYDYDGTTLTPVICLYVDDIDNSTEQVTLNLQDKRFA